MSAQSDTFTNKETRRHECLKKNFHTWLKYASKDTQEHVATWTSSVIIVQPFPRTAESGGQTTMKVKEQAATLLGMQRAKSNLPPSPEGCRKVLSLAAKLVALVSWEPAREFCRLWVVLAAGEYNFGTCSTCNNLHATLKWKVACNQSASRKSYNKLITVM